MYKHQWTTYAVMDYLPTPHWAPGAKSKDGRGSWKCADEPAPVQVLLSPKPSQGFPACGKACSSNTPRCPCAEKGI